MGPMTHAPWLGSCVFDGARAFEGVAPDLDRHCQRIVRSAESFGLKILKPAGEIEEIIREGIAKFPKGRRSISARCSGPRTASSMSIPNRRKFCVSVYDSPLPEPKGFSVDLLALPPAVATNMRRPMPRPPATIPIRRAPCARRGPAASTMR